MISIKEKTISSHCIKGLPVLSEHNLWLKEVDSCLLHTSIFNLEDSFNRYSNKLSEYPNFKSKNKSRKSYQTNNVTSNYKGKQYNSIEVKLEKRIIKSPKLKEISIRKWECPNCINLNERDIHASINILW